MSCLDMYPSRTNHVGYTELNIQYISSLSTDRETCGLVSFEYLEFARLLAYITLQEPEYGSISMNCWCCAKPVYNKDEKAQDDANHSAEKLDSKNAAAMSMLSTIDVLKT
jgi:hypothetical protein